MNAFARRALALVSLTLWPATALAQNCNTADRSILLLLDMSGSMNAALPNGETRITVARRATKGVAALLPAEAQLSLRLYGAQSPASRKNCQDTHQAVPFGAAGKLADSIAKVVDEARAQGYTPIAYSLQQAANDFPAGAKQRVIVLVSDGKETCQGDPVVAAKALAAKGIVIHTIGFIVDTAARMQLQSVARMTGGKYFDAPVGPELPNTLKDAFAACKQKMVAQPKVPKPGKLRMSSAVYSYAVYNSETGEKVTTLDRMKLEANLPAGIYEVQIGAARWKGIEVRPGETTTINPGTVRLVPGRGAVILDSETGESHGTFDRMNTAVTVMPGLYDVKFSSLYWRYVKVDGGAVTELKLVQIKLADGLKWKSARVTTKDGTEVFRFDAVTWQAVLPPGEYVVEVDGQKYPFKGEAGAVFEVKP